MSHKQIACEDKSQENVNPDAEYDHKSKQVQETTSYVQLWRAEEQEENLS